MQFPIESLRSGEEFNRFSPGRMLCYYVCRCKKIWLRDGKVLVYVDYMHQYNVILTNTFALLYKLVF